MNIRLIILLPFLVGGCNSYQKSEDTPAKGVGELPSEFDKTRGKPPAYFPKEIPASCVENPMPAFDETIKILSDNCWKISSEATFPFGKSTLDFWFNEQLGFVKMNYINYGGQKLTIELMKVIDK